MVQTLILFCPSLFKFFQLSWILLKYLQFSKLHWELLVKHAKPSALSSCGSLAGESLWTLPKWKQRDWFSAFGHLEAFPGGDLHLHLFFFSDLWNMFDRLYVNPLRNFLVWLLWCLILPTLGVREFFTRGYMFKFFVFCQGNASWQVSRDMINLDLRSFSWVGEEWARTVFVERSKSQW